MDSPTYRNDENRWIENRIASLTPPPGWKPDADRAFERVMKQREPSSASRWVRVSMAAAVLAATGLVLMLLPWHVLWTPEAATGASRVQAPQRDKQIAPSTESAVTPAAITPAPHSPGEAYPTSAPSAATGKAERVQSGITQSVMGRIQQAYGVPPTPPSQTLQAATEQQGNPVPSPSGVTQPILVSKVQPEYTQEAKENRITGTVELLCLVGTDGTVKVQSIKKSLGYGLDESAWAAVEQWRFEPGKKDGVPIPTEVSIEVHFGLK